MNNKIAANYTCDVLRPKVITDHILCNIDIYCKNTCFRGKNAKNCPEAPPGHCWPVTMTFLLGGNFAIQEEILTNLERFN